MQGWDKLNASVDASIGLMQMQVQCEGQLSAMDAIKWLGQVMHQKPQKVWIPVVME